MGTSKTTSESSIFPKGNKITNNYFTGTTYLEMLVPGQSVFNCPIGHVSFEAGARNNWHKHPGGQILLVTEGIGQYQERGKKIQLIQKGDVVLIHPDVEHWHGASPEAAMTHIAISTNVQLGEAIWLEPVSEQDYNSYKKQ